MKSCSWYLLKYTIIFVIFKHFFGIPAVAYSADLSKNKDNFSNSKIQNPNGLEIWDPWKKPGPKKLKLLSP